MLGTQENVGLTVDRPANQLKLICPCHTLAKENQRTENRRRLHERIHGRTSSVR